MIIINCPLRTESIVEVLENYNEKGIHFKLIEKSGMKLVFETKGIAGIEAVDFVKQLIRSYDFGKALYFQVKYE